MLYQLPLPSEYSSLSEERTFERIGELKQQLGPRLVILEYSDRH